MNNPNDIQSESFSARCETQGKTIVVWMRGNADMAVHDRLKPFLDAVDQMVRKAKASEAVFEFKELYFMNSSCLSLVLRFLNGVVALSAPERYRVRFRSNPNLRWQKKSLAALQAYATELVVVE